ncbi:PIG-L family deacetylase [Sinomonas cyclohexanicum]|jgi:LmbE family N-acetylglucosaminyl deacetylase|nr:PIG-L family deacetylase [Corynebacterium cyclohexanicum]
MVVVAHTDDDLLFLSPDILHVVQANQPLLLVYTTAGEAGEGSDYWQSLEEGIRSTYAQIAGTDNSWSDLPNGVPGRSFSRQGLDGTGIEVAFLHIPDGRTDGTGTATYGYDSIIKLWDGRIDTVGLVDGSDYYGRDDLISLLTALMVDFAPTQILTQTWPGAYTDTGDHSDHWATANFAREASHAYAAGQSLTGYYAYIIGDWDENVSGDDLDAKTAAFTNFAGYDHNIGVPYAQDTYGLWLKRQYISATE